VSNGLVKIRASTIPFLSGENTMARPVDTLSVPTGKGALINASLWENEVEQGDQRYTTYSVSIEKRYRDGDTWKTAKSFKAHELPRDPDLR
jgi:hypothetical protein